MLLDYIPDNSLGATSGTVYVYASGSVAPGQVQVSKSGTYANSVNVSVGNFSSYTGMAGYDWRASIAVTSNSSQGWPLSSDSTVVLTVSTSAGVIVGSVDVLLSSTSAWSIQPSIANYPDSWTTRLFPFYLYCVNLFSVNEISWVGDQSFGIDQVDSVVPSTALSGFNYRLALHIGCYTGQFTGRHYIYIYYNGVSIGTFTVRNY